MKQILRLVPSFCYEENMHVLSFIILPKLLYTKIFIYSKKKKDKTLKLFIQVDEYKAILQFIDSEMTRIFRTIKREKHKN